MTLRRVNILIGFGSVLKQIGAQAKGIMQETDGSQRSRWYWFKAVVMIKS